MSSGRNRSIPVTPYQERAEQRVKRNDNTRIHENQKETCKENETKIVRYWSHYPALKRGKYKDFPIVNERKDEDTDLIVALLSTPPPLPPLLPSLVLGAGGEPFVFTWV